jgi:hypothetical protein
VVVGVVEAAGVAIGVAGGAAIGVAGGVVIKTTSSAAVRVANGIGGVAGGGERQGSYVD